MLARVARSSSNTLAPRLAGAWAGSSRTAVTGTAFDPREKAAENVYFKKDEEALLRKLLSKVKAQADEVDVHAAAGQKAAELSQLKSIVGSKLDDATLEKLVSWKHEH